MSERNGKPNPKGKRTHVLTKRVMGKRGNDGTSSVWRERFAGYAREGVVYEKGQGVDAHEFAERRGLEIEKL